MLYSQYRFSFYLNATHAIYIDGKLGAAHPHTWEIILHTVNGSDGFVMFNDVEKKIEGFLEKYQNKFINDFSPFNTLNPTLEHITRFLLERLQKVLDPMGWLIFTIEVSETPARSYVISTVENNQVYNLERKNLAGDIISTAFSNEKTS